ncbi:MAG: phage tail tape measure protein [Hyphomicrobiales bacterium]|nr:phage tail tape measure protein [Hyphomicrobiales bacterium]
MSKTPVYSTPAEMLSAPASLASSSAFLTQDLAAIKMQIDGVNASAISMSASLVKAFANASQGGRSFSATLQTVAASLAQTLGGVGAGYLSAGLSSIFSGFSLGGGGGAGATVAPFADGGIVASPTFFGSGGSLGLMGERGAEAIVPLARGPNGQLGLAAPPARAAPVVVNIQTQDAASFKRSESLIAASLARAVARGSRGL